MKDKDTYFKKIYAENKDRIYRICCLYEPDADARKAGYDLPVLEFLNRTEERYTFKNRHQMAYLIPMFLLADAGIFLILYSKFWGTGTGLDAGSTVLSRFFRRY